MPFIEKISPKIEFLEKTENSPWIGHCSPCIGQTVWRPGNILPLPQCFKIPDMDIFLSFI